MSPPDFQKYPIYKKKRRAASLALIMKMSCANVHANRTKNGGRKLPDVKHECYGKLSVKSVLKPLISIIVMQLGISPGSYL